jgi:hypothetical protein
MDPFLDELVQAWKGVKSYTNVEASYWSPGQSFVQACPEGCGLEDTDWTSMAHCIPAVDAYRRTMFCHAHGFARIYVITGPQASEHGWEPHQ